MQLSTPIIMTEWSLQKDAGATAVFSTSGETVTMTALDAEKGFVYWPMVAFPGDVFEVSCMARVISGNSAGMVVDVPNGTQLDRLIFDSEEWKLYTLKVVIDTAGDLNAGLVIGELAFGLGVITSGAGSAEIARPQVKLIKGQGCQRLVASGVLQVDQADNVTWLTSFDMIGFAFNPVFNAGDITIDLSIPIDTQRGTFQITHRAMPRITTTSDGFDNAAGCIDFHAEGVDAQTGSFVVSGWHKATDTKITTYAGKSNRFAVIDIWMQ